MKKTETGMQASVTEKMLFLSALLAGCLEIPRHLPKEGRDFFFVRRLPDYPDKGGANDNAITFRS